MSSNAPVVMFFRLAHRRGHSQARPWTLRPDGYLTDDRRLFRVVSRLYVAREHVLVALEDCATLDVRVYAQTELGAMGLRAVRAAETETVTARGAASSDARGTGDHTLALAQLEGGA